MTIRKKIIGGFLIVFVVGLILGIVGLVSTSSLTGNADDLHQLQIGNTGVSSVLNAHYVWRHSLTEAVLSGKEFTGSLDPETCALGKWMASDEAKNVTDPEVLSLIAGVTEPHKYIHTEAADIVEMLQNGDNEAAKDMLINQILPKTQEVITLLTSMETRYRVLLEEKNEGIVKTGEQTTVFIIILLAVSFVASLVFGGLVTSSIMRPLRKLTQAAETIATGDLDVDVSYNVNDQIGALAMSFNKMIENTKQQVIVAESMAENDFTASIRPRSGKDKMGYAMAKMLGNLNEMIAQINSATQQVASGSKQIADGAQTLAQGSTEQAAAIEQLSASVSAVEGKTKQNSEMATRAAHLAGTIKENAEKGSRQMDAMMNAVREINQASQNINKVIKVIDDIAFQTNILSLNAAVEAARAGQHGKGFAVVAEEVRNLAAKSAEAAKDTGGLIANSMEKAELGARIAGETASSLTEIVSGINESAQIVSEIEKSADEQTTDIEQINRGINQVAQVVQQNSATAEESAAASEEMSGQSLMLEELVARFRIKEQQNHRMALNTGMEDFGEGLPEPKRIRSEGTEAFGKY